MESCSHEGLLEYVTKLMRYQVSSLFLTRHFYLLQYLEGLLYKNNGDGDDAPTESTDLIAKGACLRRDSFRITVGITRGTSMPDRSG